MTRTLIKRATAIAAALLLGLTAGASAQTQWRDAVILKFDAPVMVPGATLQPGSYRFELEQAMGSRHTVRVTSEDGSKLLTLTQAIPIKRDDPSGDIVMRYAATDASAPPAIKAYFYPGSVYGHEFLYSDKEAKDIAGTSKELVLSTDAEGGELTEQGKVRVYHPTGESEIWKGDEATNREWEDWWSQREKNGDRASSGQQSSTTPMVQRDFSDAMRVKVDDLEDQSAKYQGKTISVDGEIDDVLGPHLFTIDEPGWIDFETETLVHLPATMAAAVREGDKVTVTGTLKRYMGADLEDEWGWLDLDDDDEATLGTRPMIEASRVVGGDDQTAMAIELPGEGDGGTWDVGIVPVVDVYAVAVTDTNGVGEVVNLKDAKVDSVADDGGLFVKGHDGTFYVRPARDNGNDVKAGDTVAIDGIILQMPRGMVDQINGPDDLNDDVYVYATSVR